MAIVRRALNEKALDLRPWLVKAGKDAEPPFSLRLNLRREEQYIQRLHAMTTEVVDSFSSMRHVETYLARFPFSRRGIPASAYIRFHLESVLNEAYILRERMGAFAFGLSREFRKESNARDIKSRADYVRGETESLFEPVSRMRGGHVHASRYDDAELSQLALWEILAEQDPSRFSAHLKRCATAVRRSNLAFVKGINDGLEGKLDRFFGYFAGLVFKPNGEIRYPTNIRGA